MANDRPRLGKITRIELYNDFGENPNSGNRENPFTIVSEDGYILSMIPKYCCSKCGYKAKNKWDECPVCGKGSLFCRPKPDIILY